MENFVKLKNKENKIKTESSESFIVYIISQIIFVVNIFLYFFVKQV